MKKTKMKRVITGILCTAMAASMLAGCAKTNQTNETKQTDSSNDADTPSAKTEGVITVDFWTAPEQFNLDFWSKYADKFNAAGMELNGKGLEVKVQMMPAQPSSEAGIQNAIATKTVPAISENINRSFANTLAGSEAVYDMSGESWFGDIVAERKIGDVVSGWAIDGAQYVLPLYVNPITLCYNSKALKALGVDSVPQTMADLTSLLNTFKEKQEDMNAEGITHFMYRAELTNSANFWERWFDIEAPYNALAKGTPLVDGNKLTADKAALTKVFEMYANMGNSLLTGTIDGIWKEDTVPVVMGCGLPWEISSNEAAGKVYGIDGDYVFGPTLVENEGDVHYNYADSKGIVLYKNDSISEEEHLGAVEFLKFVFTGAVKDSFDLDWLETTSMLPVRGDLQDNETLKVYFDAKPALKDVSAFVADAIPGMAHQKGGDIMTAIGEKAIVPMLNDVIAVSGINENPDVSKYVDAALEAMKQAGSLE